MKYLGVDYGKSKIGLALSDGQMASPLRVVSTSSLKDSLQKISHIIKSEGVERVVVGVPESGEARSFAKKFIEELEKSLEKIEIIGVPETLSSVRGKELMIDLNLSKKERQKEDAYSAVIILQEFLNSLN